MGVAAPTPPRTVLRYFLAAMMVCAAALAFVGAMATVLVLARAVRDGRAPADTWSLAGWIVAFFGLAAFFAAVARRLMADDAGRPPLVLRAGAVLVALLGAAATAIGILVPVELWFLAVPGVVCLAGAGAILRDARRE